MPEPLKLNDWAVVIKLGVFGAPASTELCQVTKVTKSGAVRVTGRSSDRLFRPAGDRYESSLVTFLRRATAEEVSSQ